MTIRAVLMDWHGTLFRSACSLSDMIVAAGTDLGRPVSEQEAMSMVARGLQARSMDAALMAAERERDRSRAAHRSATRMWFRAAGIDDEELLDAIYEVFVTRGLEPYADTESALRELRELKIRVVVVSNCGWDIRRNFAAYGLERYVAGFVLSCEHGIVKPEPELFRIAYRLLGLGPEAVMMVGNDPVADGAAAHVGIAALILPDSAPGPSRGLDLVVRLLRSEAASWPVERP